MEQNNEVRSLPVGSAFIILGFSCLLLSISFGFTASLQYLFPQLLADNLSFQKTRPLHVFLAINWIFACISGLIYSIIPKVANRPLFSKQLSLIHLALHVITIVIIVVGFFNGHFSGREYLEFPPWIVVIIISYWLLLAVNFFKTLQPRLAEAPVYFWMWCTGILFFLITITEAQLWLLPYFNTNIIRDITVQWKANGSMVGSWNMLIYGTAMYVMEQVTDDKTIGRDKKSFAFYFLGLTNLLFNWGHHTYVVPANPAIKQIAYIISMTELVLLANILLTWSATFKKKLATDYEVTHSFLTKADAWVLINLVLAIAMSVPAINQYTHGTQITVAHAMGTTIGINTLLLMGCVVYMIEKQLTAKAKQQLKLGLKTIHSSLFFFWISLLAAGVIRSLGISSNQNFAKISTEVQPYLRFFSSFGFLLIVGIALVASTSMASIWKYRR